MDDMDTSPGLLVWIDVPAGSVTLSAGGYLDAPSTFEVPAFRIARTPITNAQYAQFVEAGGYASADWWTPTGWLLRERHGWAEPRAWSYARRAIAPVMGVSFHEAVAFCRWLSETSGEAVTLPTEQQWQRAAQGDDGREFPWGNADPDDALCNWARAYDGPTAVDAFPAGASPFDVLDLCGNAWEWCLTGWETGATDLDSRERRVVRGGSWVNDSPLTLSVTLRDGPYPPDGYHLCGFRCVHMA